MVNKLNNGSCRAGVARCLKVALVCGIALVARDVAAQQWGDLTGKVIFDGKAPDPGKLTVNKDTEVCGKMPLHDEALEVDASGGIKNVVIYAITKGIKEHPDYAASKDAKVEYDNKGCRFEPHIVPLRLTQTLVIKNSDAVGHNTNLQPLGDTAINPLIAAGGTHEHKFNRAQTRPVPATCNIHPWMKGYILPRDNAYMAVTAADGTFKIANLPAGKVEFQVWHETCGYVDTPQWKKGKFTQDIKAGANDLGTVKLGAAVLKAK